MMSPLHLLMMFYLHRLLLITGALGTEDTMCLDTSSGNIKLELLDNNINITEDKNSYMSCLWNSSVCYVECVANQIPSLNFSTSNMLCEKTSAQLYPSKAEFLILSLNSYCTLTLCEEVAILSLVENLSSSTVEGLKKLHNIKNACRALFSLSNNVKIIFIGIERTVIHNILKEHPVGKSEFNLGDLGLSIVHLNLTNSSSGALQRRVNVPAPQLLPENRKFIPETWLPIDALSDVPQENRTVGLVTYQSPNHFKMNKELFSSLAIRIEILGGTRLINLSTSVKMKFRLFDGTDRHNNSRVLCHFFDDHVSWRWKTDGCETYISYNDDLTEVECSCDHATPFAVLLVRDPIDSGHWKILSYISYVGCSLSAFFTASSFLSYIINRNPRAEHSVFIHVSLSGALFLLNVSFLLSEWGASVKPEWVCVLIAAVMHYSLLCCFSWMTMEALHLYLLLVKVFNTYYKHYLLKLSIISWGIPTVLVGVALAVKDQKKFYGLLQAVMTDTNQTTAICWIVEDSFLYAVNLTYFALTFIFNSGVLLAVGFRICKLKGKAGAKKMSLTPTCNDVCTVLGLTCLLGTTWGLAFLSSGYVNYPILYLFCIFNSLQGFFIFLWICGKARKQKQIVPGTKSSSAGLDSFKVKSKEGLFPGINPYTGSPGNWGSDRGGLATNICPDLAPI